MECSQKGSVKHEKVGRLKRQDTGGQRVRGASQSFQSIEAVRYNNSVWKYSGVRSLRPSPTRASVGRSGGAHVGSGKRGRGEENNNKRQKEVVIGDWGAKVKICMMRAIYSQDCHILTCKTHTHV